ncbi:hypothetical protein ACROYT_G022826 [Oculina patagonica]
MKMLAALLLVSFLAEVAICEDNQTMAMNFLNQFGYISRTRSGNHDVPTAIKKFQEFFGLKVSGKLDDSTIGLMKKSRCGMSDPIGENRRRRYVTRGKWTKSHLTYYVKPGEDLPHDQQRQIFADALQFWADVSWLTFSEAGSAGEADIKISFGRHTHGGTSVESTCSLNPFDGPGKVLAHAYFPEDGRAHFDEDETFTHGTYSGINLLFVAVHEFGHSLGLMHTNIEGAIMYPYYTGYVPDLQLHDDDIDGIQALYGKIGSACGGPTALLIDLSNPQDGSVNSPGYPNRYENYQNCQWLIKAPYGERIHITFTTFDVEYDGSGCRYDSVKIFDGENSDASLLSKSCGSSLPEPVSSSGRYIYMQFTSDKSVTGQGFLARYGVLK